jgi:hypothetical protein
MGAGNKVLIVMRATALMSALAVIGLGAWGKDLSLKLAEEEANNIIAQVLIHDVDARGASMTQLIPEEAEDIVQFWRGFFKAITDGTARIWLCIAAVCFVPLVMPFRTDIIRVVWPF